GKYRLKARGFDRWGQPTTLEGVVRARQTTDPLGRVTETVDRHGQRSVFHYDDRGRLGGGIEPRTKPFELRYLGASDDLAGATVEGRNRAGTGEVPVLTRLDRLRGRSETWQGGTQAVEVT